MKERYRYNNITPKRMDYIKEINNILSEYAEQGYRLTLRQLYYQLVARDVIPNKVQEYAKLSTTLVMSRMNGLTDWDMIEDRIRKPHLLYWVTGIEDAIKDTINHYRLDRQAWQGNCIEIWTEKDAVSNILKRVSQYYHVRLMINRGYSSCSAMKEAYNRLYFSSRRQHKIILYVGDHDPSGLDMIRDIEDRLSEFGLDNYEIIHVALTRDQIDEFTPPPNPAKITDPRAKWYIGEHGEESWELDALRPNILEEIVKNILLKYMDIQKFNEMLEKEEEDKTKLKDMVQKIIK